MEGKTGMQFKEYGAENINFSFVISVLIMLIVWFI